MAEITSEQRSAPWNVVFLSECDEVIAGFYHKPGQLPITFEAAVAELQANFSFDFRMRREQKPDDFTPALWPAKDSSDGDVIEFHSDLEINDAGVKIITPGRYYVLFHEKNCKEGEHAFCTPSQIIVSPPCVSFISKSEVHNASYRPILPNSTTEYKPSEQPGTDADGADQFTWWRQISVAPAVAIPGDDRTRESRLEVMKMWATSAADSRRNGGLCAITGAGMPSRNHAGKDFVSGLVLEAYHIVPPPHFDVYPLASDPEAADGGLGERFGLTWTPSANGILLLPHIYSLFKARLIAIHPDTLHIRCFVPCDLTDQYNGSRAKFAPGKQPDKNALRWHWDMCVAENMRARPARPRGNSASDQDDNVRVDMNAIMDHIPNLRLHDQARSPDGGGGPIRTGTGHESRPDDDLQFCTQECMLGLKHGGALDANCPNYAAHFVLSGSTTRPGKHRKTWGTRLAWTGGQPPATWHSWSGRRDPRARAWLEVLPGRFGRMGQLVKVTRWGNYVLVGKGMPAGRAAASLRHEHAVYRRLEPLQGSAVTTCLGLVRLDPPMRYTCAEPLDALLLQAWVGEPVGGVGLAPEDEARHVRWSEEEVRARGVHHLSKGKHLLWSREKARVMVIDFEDDQVDFA